MLCLELQHCLDATTTNRRVLGILADIRFPMPTALAFLAIGMDNKFVSVIGVYVVRQKFKLRNIYQFLERVMNLSVNDKLWKKTGKWLDFGIKRFSNCFVTTFQFQRWQQSSTRLK